MNVVNYSITMIWDGPNDTACIDAGERARRIVRERRKEWRGFLYSRSLDLEYVIQDEIIKAVKADRERRKTII